MGLAMEFVVMHVAERDQVFKSIRPPVLVMLLVMKLQHFSGVIWRKLRSAPTAFNTLKAIALQNCNTNCVGD